MCRKCYNTAYRNGLRVKEYKRPSHEYFFEKVEVADCWEWTANRDNDGYGKFAIRGVGTFQAHRWCWEFLVGVIPDGLVLDHLCRNRGCVNPDHLEPVTPEENMRRGLLGKKLVGLAA
jgi:hypothetical protein